MGEEGWEEEDWFAQSFTDERTAQSTRAKMARHPGVRCCVFAERDGYVLVVLGPRSALDAAYCIVDWPAASHVILDADALREVRAAVYAAAA